MRGLRLGGKKGGRRFNDCVNYSIKFISHSVLGIDSKNSKLIGKSKVCSFLRLIQ